MINCEINNMSHPQVVPWKTTDEIETLRTLFFSEEEEDKRKAVRKVKAYMIRGKLLHAIESTCLLTSTILNDKPDAEPLNVRMAYSMVLIRFVNGLLDPYQKAVHAIPLHGLARKLNLPSSFVEIRHVATHESLPNLGILRTLAQNALRWLYDNFWTKNDFAQDKEKFKIRSNPQKISEDDAEQFRANLKQNLRVYRRFHRSGVRMVSQKDNDPETKEYLSNLRQLGDFVKLKDYSLEETMLVLLSVLCFKNVLIISKKGVRFAQMQALYTPLLEHLESAVFKRQNETSFYYCLAEYLLSKQNDYVAKKTGGYVFTEQYEIEMSGKWLKHVMVPKLSGPLVKMEDSLDLIAKYPHCPLNQQLLKDLESKFIKDKLNKYIQDSKYIEDRIVKLLEMEQPHSDKKRTIDTDNILDDLDNLKKRIKSVKTENENTVSKDPFVYFQKYEFYEPTPFGIPPI